MRRAEHRTGPGPAIALEHAVQRRLRRQSRWLGALAALLAVICAVLAGAWRAEHRRADCWRGYVEADGPPAEGDCRQLDR